MTVRPPLFVFIIRRGEHGQAAQTHQQEVTALKSNGKFQHKENTMKFIYDNISNTILCIGAAYILMDCMGW